MSTADKLTYLNETKGLIKDNINLGGGNLTTEPFRQYAITLKNIYKDFLANGIGTLWNNWEKVTGTGTSLNLSPTIQGEMEFTYKGNTSQNGTPTPTSPIPINVVSGDNTINICGKNWFELSNFQNNSTGRTSFVVNDNDIVMTAITGGTYRYIYKQIDNLTIGQPYTIKIGNHNDTSTNKLAQWGITTTGGQYYNSVQTLSNTQTLTITPTETSIQFRAGYLTNSCSANDTLTIGNIQLEKGNQATTYEPYIGNSYQVNLRTYLPSEYTPVEYIESSSTQYIDTGFKPNQDTRVVLDYIDNYTQASFILGARSSNASNQYAITDLDTNNIRSDYNARQQNLSRTIGIRYVLDKNKNKNYLYQNGNLVASNSIDYNNFTPNINMYLFNINNNGSVGSPGAKIRLYSCKIYDNGTLVRNFVPCYRNSDNLIGLYDAQNGGFYTNQGTGTFTKGNDIPNGIELCKIGNYQDYFYKGTGKNLFDNSNIQVGYYININTGVPYANSSWNTSYLIKVNPNTIYTLSNNGGNGQLAIIQYKGNEQTQTNFITYQQTTLGNTNLLTITTDSQCQYLVVGYRNDKGQTDIQLEKGISKTTYEPFGEKGKWYLHKEIGKVVLDGSESWKLYGGVFYIDSVINDYLKESSITTFCNYFKGATNKTTQQGAYENGNNTTCFRIGDSTNRFIIRDDSCSTANDLKTWLASNPTTIYYVLAEPTTEEITDTTLLEQLEEAKISYEGQTNISQINNDLPFNLVVKALKNI